MSLADHLALWAPNPVSEYRRHRLETTRALLETYFRGRAGFVNPAPLLNGHQVMAEFELKPGPQLGQILEELREAQAVGEATTVEQAREWLAQRLATGEM